MFVEIDSDTNTDSEQVFHFHSFGISDRHFHVTKPYHIMSGSIGIVSEKEKPYMAVDISPIFTRDHTNGHDISMII